MTESIGVIDCVVAPHTPLEVAEGQVGVDEHFMDKVRMPEDMRRGIEMAEEIGLDLVEVSPTADPPVCKLMDFGKYKYEAQKKASEARKKQKVIEIKEIKLRPTIDDADYQVKMRNMRRFLEEGDKVKVTLRFRGREMVHQELGAKVLDRVRDDLAEIAKVEQMPKLEGRQMTMVISHK